jgi:putative thiamine transport system permease protein
MAQALRAIRAVKAKTVKGAKLSWALPLFLAMLVATPVLGTVWSAIVEALNMQAWGLVRDDPQLPRALVMTLWSGLAATALSVALSAWLLSRGFPGPMWMRTVRALPAMLAVPHAAFAIGLAFLIAPSGWLLRAFSPWATGFDAPPPWATTQDPWGLGLIAVLVAKEVPFLLWAAATQLQRADTAARWSRELDVARSMGYAPRTAWWRVLWPQLWPRLTGPILAVLAYSLTVVDMALVIGPTSPPTLSVLAWQWLLDADATINAQGAAAAWLLGAVVALAAGALWAMRGLLRRRTQWISGDRGRRARTAIWASTVVKGVRGGGRIFLTLRSIATGYPLFLWAALYIAVMMSLAVGSVSGVWPFPRLWPESLSLQGWRSVFTSASTLWTTAALAAISSATALVWAVAWLECAPPAWDAHLRRLIYLPLILPSVLWVVGLHRLCLAWGIDARWQGLWLVHSLAAAPYVLIALSPAYLGFDARYRQIAASLQKNRLTFLLRVKWPLLKASLWGALAVGFAVSVAQYLPTLFVGAGRFATVTTEAVTLASGAQRSLTAAYAWLQWLLPALMFGVAAWLGRPRRFTRVAFNALQAVVSNRASRTGASGGPAS